MHYNSFCLTVQEIKKILLEFHKEKGYKLFKSFPLVSTDSTVMFVNATITPFKSWFTDDSIHPENYALIQKCLRMGGASKLKSVGIDPYCFTFFEMFGSGTFSTSLEEIVSYLMEFLAALGIKRERLYFTIPINEEFHTALRRNGVEDTRIFQLKENDYFWQEWKFGVPGPLGHGLTVIFSRFSKEVDSIEQLINNQDQFIELLNLIYVHSQSLPDGRIVPIANPGFDLGVGIERLAAVLQGCDAYHIDTIFPLIETIKNFLIVESGKVDEISARICADHFRAIYVLRAEKLTPSNKKHGYILRKLIRRFIETVWMSIGRVIPTKKLVEDLSYAFENYGGVSGVEKCTDIVDIIEKEESALLNILKRAEKIICQHPEIPLQKLYDTYGISQTLLTLIQ